MFFNRLIFFSHYILYKVIALKCNQYSNNIKLTVCIYGQINYWKVVIEKKRKNVFFFTAYMTHQWHQSCGDFNWSPSLAHHACLSLALFIIENSILCWIVTMSNSSVTNKQSLYLIYIVYILFNYTIIIMKILRQLSCIINTWRIFECKVYIRYILYILYIYAYTA